MPIDESVRCDRCGAQIVRESALEALLDETVYYFCSLRCLEEKDYVPGREVQPEDGQVTLEGS